MRYFYILGTMAVVCMAMYLSAFKNVRYSVEQSTFKLAGQCTMKNWTFVSKEAKGDAEFEVKDDLIKDVRSLKLILPAKSLQSDNGSMNNHAYDALKTGQHPNITFELIKVDKIVPAGKSVQITAQGNLTVAGETKPVTLNANGTVFNNKVSLQGTYDTKMSNFNISPPKFALGGIKTQDDVTVNFQATFKQ
jgi:polyisoprenoid-binding protein YceI